MRQVLLLDAHDLATLKTGAPMLIQTGTGVVEVRYETARLAKPIGSVNGQPGKPQLVTTQCPYCKKQYVSIRAHISVKHPGKGLVATGGVKCRWCAKRYPTRRSAFRHEIRIHPKRIHPEPVKKETPA